MRVLIPDSCQRGLVTCFHSTIDSAANMKVDYTTLLLHVVLLAAIGVLLAKLRHNASDLDAATGLSLPAADESQGRDARDQMTS